MSSTRTSPRATWREILTGPSRELVVVIGEHAQARRALLARALTEEKGAIALDLSSSLDPALLAFDAQPSVLEREALALACADAVDASELCRALTTEDGRRRARLAQLLSTVGARSAHGALLVVVEGDDDDGRFAMRLRFLLRLVADQGARAVLLARRDAPETFADRVVCVVAEPLRLVVQNAVTEAV